MPEKRPHPDDHFQNGDAKRSRSNQASPAQDRPNGSMMEDKAEAERKARIAMLKAKMSAQRSGAAAPSTPSPISPAPAAPSLPTATPAVQNDASARLAALRARVAANTKPSVEEKPKFDMAEAIARAKERAAAAGVPQRVASPAVVPAPPSQEDNFGRARGGLGVGLHPALLGDVSVTNTSSRGRQAIAPKFGNRRLDAAADATREKKKDLDLYSKAVDLEAERKNPYYDPSFAPAKERKAKPLTFNPAGKFIAQAQALKEQEHLEAMKRKIAAETRVSNLQEDLEKVFLVPVPPEIEWWDEGLLTDKTYAHFDEPGKSKIDTEDSLITVYIQHPVLLMPPQEKNAPASKPMYLTKTEQAKLRRQKRHADLKEEQAKIRLGFKEPPPPKVKKSNMMRVLGELAVKDPTAVEARVNREIAQRAADHEAANEERKLTKEQRAEKLRLQQEADAKKGIKVSVYKVDNLCYGKHRYQIDVNAKEHGLTGTVILHPQLNLVIVEGGAYSVTAFRKLMLNRIKWTENVAPAPAKEERREVERVWLRAEDEEGKPKDMSLNKCTLVWEGEEKQRAFRKWTSKVCETDGEAKEALKWNKMENMWTLAKSMGKIT
ncbi:U4/U5/U6 small nuclear ribonucleoprotein prp3 [Elasticomyces elasticus]|nr:U4/U5/U6 small nuclear ribonucleoprotein prp3 [Elasticomyces elasticus]KAK4997924.1 U4/U5/U6 small nuclear ribonucleoprotein prp3 [Elasticomyces elasticus]